MVRSKHRSKNNTLDSRRVAFLCFLQTRSCKLFLPKEICGNQFYGSIKKNHSSLAHWALGCDLIQNQQGTTCLEGPWYVRAITQCLFTIVTDCWCVQCDCKLCPLFRSDLVRYKLFPCQFTSSSPCLLWLMPSELANPLITSYEKLLEIICQLLN